MLALSQKEEKKSRSDEAKVEQVGAGWQCWLVGKKNIQEVTCNVHTYIYTETTLKETIAKELQKADPNVISGGKEGRKEGRG